MVESTAALPSSVGTSGVTAIPSIEGTLQNPIPPYYKSYKITPLSIFRHIIYWSFVTLIIFSISKLKRTSNEAFAFTFVAILILFILFNFGYWIISRFYDISQKCYDPKLLSQTEMDNIERELSEVKERLNQAKDIFNAAESPEAQEEARTRMTELYVAKQMLAKRFSQQSIIRPKLMFLIIYGTPFVRIGNDLEANENGIANSSAAPLISIQQPSTSAQPSSSGTTNQTFIEEENHGSTVALCEKRKDSDTAVF